ncbi:MAG: outer membrane beta-barrel domain-containing protein [Desulfuromonadales bacterium]|nr:outer membrane beta-barrel domain-containing protein [Desulfuromonadales bacterium]
MKKCLLLTVAGILACGTIAFAANREGQFSLSPVIGGYTFDGRQHLDTSLIYGLRGGYNFTKHLGVEALFDYVNTEPTTSKADVNMYRYGGELLYHFFPDNAFVPYLAAGFSGLHFDANGVDGRVRGAFDYGVGAKYFTCDSFALRADVRHIIYSVNDRTLNNIEYTLGAYIPFGGVTPAVKPVEPPPAPAPAPAPIVVEPPPAPAPPAAPTAALTVNPASVTKGQSAALNWKSQYASGCDIQPGIGAVPPMGAREITPVADTTFTLSCSGAGGTATSSAGVTVVIPPPPAPVKPKAAERFCDKPSVVVVEFDTDKSVIKTKYDEDLNKLGTFLKEWSKAKGEISGHTDSVGTDKYNIKLSQRRAASVKKYLEEKFNIAPERLTTEGYGESKPIASNKTKAGRQLNRRIETNFTCD